MDRIGLYLDEDAMDSDLVAALRSRNVETQTAMESGTAGRSDDQQLLFAAERGLVLYTCNISDFFGLHNQWTASGRSHCGIILVPQQRYRVGEQLRRILRLRAALTAQDIRNQVQFLSNWG